VILLTNRVHAARARRPSQVISDVRADLADAAALAVVEGPYGMAGMSSVFRADKALGWNKPIRKTRSRYARRSRSTSRSYVSSKKTSVRPVAKKSTTVKKSTAKAKSSVVKAKSTKPASKPVAKVTRVTTSRSTAAAPGNKPKSTRR
jgi:hypothetical protein